MKYTLTKYDAAGNIFLLVRTASFVSSQKRKKVYAKLAQRMCETLRGAGADGLLVVSPSARADFALDVFNADGSWAERSGNGLRAAVALARKLSPRQKRWTISCGSDVVAANVVKGSVSSGFFISAEVGQPVFGSTTMQRMDSGKAPELQELIIDSERIEYLSVQIGNPHAVIPVRKFSRNWEEIGERIAKNRRFKNGVNVEFVRVINARKIEVRVFERGAGPTESSGTGACAAVSVMKVLGKVSSKVAVQFAKQELTVTWNDWEQPIIAQGVVKELFTMQVIV